MQTPQKKTIYGYEFMQYELATIPACRDAGVHGEKYQEQY